MGSLQLMKGTLDVLVLKALTWAPMHGFEIAKWLEAQSGGKLGIEDSALYQALYRLEERGYVSADWGVTENNRRARYYTIEKAGSQHLKEEVVRLAEYTQALNAVLALEQGRS